MISDNGLFIDTSDAEGKFRGLCSPETKSLRLTPAFLSRSEQALFNKLIPRLELPPATENQPAHEIGDIAVPMSTGDIAMRVRILMPDGAPAENATVELWTRLKKSSRPCQNQLVDACGEKLYGTVTDSNGDCTLTPSIRFDEPQYAVVAFPRIAPRFFGELCLDKTKQTAEPRLQILQLVATRELRGLVEYNRRPVQAMRIVATPLGPTAPQTRSTSDGPSFIKYQAASDSDGYYSIRVPDTESYSVNLGYGAMLDATSRSSMGRNLPVLFQPHLKPDGQATGDDRIDGPTISIFRGHGFIRGEVLGSNGKPFYTEVHFDLPLGHVIQGLRCRPLNRDSEGNFALSFGKFELTGVPEGQWLAYGSVRTPMTKAVGNQPKKDSPLVPVAAGDDSVVIRLDRHSR